MGLAPSREIDACRVIPYQLIQAMTPTISGFRDSRQGDESFSFSSQMTKIFQKCSRIDKIKS